MFDLSVDPEEMNALENKNAPQGRTALSEALDRPVEFAFRIELSQPRTAKKEVSAVIRIPSGIKRAWRGSDPDSSCSNDSRLYRGHRSLYMGSQK